MLVLIAVVLVLGVLGVVIRILIAERRTYRR
jgi:hypothetical protein